jgi:hypothetical protein
MDWHKSAGGYISDDGRYQIVPLARVENGNLVYRALRHFDNGTYKCIGIRLDADDAKELCERDSI